MNRILRLIYLITLVLLIIPFYSFSENKKLPDVVVKKMPSNIDEFLALRDKIAVTPQGGAAIMVVALIIYSKDNQTGGQCLAIAVDSSRLVEGDTYKGYSLPEKDIQLISDQFKSKPYIANSYFNGATPENGYKIPEKKIKLSFSINDYSGNMEEGEYKVFIKSSGDNNDRTIKVKLNNKGLWKAVEWSTIIVGVKAPLKDDNL